MNKLFLFFRRMGDYSLVGTSSSCVEESDGNAMIYPQFIPIRGKYSASIKNLIDDLHATENNPEMFEQIIKDAEASGITQEYIFQTAYYEKIPKWVKHLLHEAPNWMKKAYSREITHLLCGSELIEKIKCLTELMKEGVCSSELKELRNMFINEDNIKYIIQKHLNGNSS